MSTTTPARPSTRAWRNAVFAVFALNGAAMATWIARVPAFRDHLGIDPAQVGLLLVGGSIGAILGLLASSQVIHVLGTRRTLLVVLIGQAVGLLVAGLAATFTTSFVGLFAGLLIFGLTSSIGDVAMNVEGAGVEHASGKTILPLFHALWSGGTVTGAAIGSAAAFASVPPALHLGIMAVVLGVAGPIATRFLPKEDPEQTAAEPKLTMRERLSIWREPRTWLIGVIMLGMGFAEGASNDWLALGMIDDRGLDQGQAALAFAVFVAAMTVGRVAGGPLVDRLGRVPVLRGAAILAFVGLAITIFVPVVWIDVIGIILWGIGASLGFPIGMSAAADDPRTAAARVSAVATVAYCAFLVGPPVIGFIGHGVGILNALILVLVLIALSLLGVPAAREQGARARPGDADQPAPGGRGRA